MLSTGGGGLEGRGGGGLFGRGGGGLAGGEGGGCWWEGEERVCLHIRYQYVTYTVPVL